MSDDVVIRVEGLSKRYGLPLVAALRRGWRRLRGQPADGGSWALRDVNLEVRRGETLGIIGRNGAGKSTLLKVLAGVTPPTRGRVELHGRIFPMIELNAGVHPELTGRENVRLLGAVMGLTRAQVKAKLPDIEDFCELGEWFDKPVRMYSSGMLARLGFGVAINVDSDIILVDEVFAVGDLQFQNKCLARLKELWEAGKTILFVSHSLDALQYLTRRGIVLERGAVAGDGTPREMLNRYEESVFADIGRERAKRRVRSRITTGQVIIEHAGILGADGRPRTDIGQGEPFGIEVTFRLEREIEQPLVTLSILNAAGMNCVWRLSAEDGFTPASFSGVETVRLWFDEGIPFANGYYEVNFALRSASNFETLDRVSGLAGFQVVGPGRARGVIDPACRWERVSAGDKAGAN